MGEGIKTLFEGKKKMIVFAALGLLGVIFVILGALGAKSEKMTAENVEISTDDAYIDELENKICNMIAKVTGDADAAVIVTCDGGTEHVYVSNGDDGDYVTVRSGGEYSLVLHRNLYPKITGVSVACCGGNDAEIRKKLIDVISTALGVSSNRICIVGTK